MSSLKGLGLEFDETMSGWIGISETDYVEGRVSGQRENTPISFSVKIIIDNLDHFINLSDHNARLAGTVSFGPLGGTMPIEDGLFNLFSVDPDEGIRHMTYSFGFTATNGMTYFLHGHKKIEDDPGFDLVEDMTTLFTTIYEGPDENAPIYGTGQLFFNLKDAPSLVGSMKVTGTFWLHRKIQAKMAFMSFAWGAIRQEYLHDVNPIYDTEYENLVLSGQVSQDGTVQNFFLVSGIHDKDFPWGDGEIFWDALLVVGDTTTGYKKYCITHRVLEGLELNVKEGTYRYKGPIFELEDGFATSFSYMRKKKAPLVECEADFKISFNQTAYNTTPLPFMIANHLVAKLATGLKWMLRSVLPSEAVLGIFITPHTVKVNEGQMSITKAGRKTDLVIVADKTFGEAERSTLRNIKEPTMLYGYICALRPEAQMARVQIHANSLRNERQRLVKDQIDAFLGAVVSRLASKEMLMERGQIRVQDLGPRGEPPADRSPLFIKLGDPIVEVNNDHFPTAIFQRRIIEVIDPSGEKCLALEEDMNLMRLEAENSVSETVVASIKNKDNLAALNSVLKETEFLNSVEGKRESMGKSKQEFSIVIKPNFMFAYNKADKTTFTDPELVRRLVEILRTKGGFERIFVVEAQSTYGEYFDNRGVREVAEYLGYVIDASAGYELVDLTEDKYETQHLGSHLGNHHVPLTWKNADYRISFAKNKTHAYAYYTLTLKNIYGALPLADKFSEYHTGRDIYHTTMEYLKAFPVDYGLIDAYLSADGPFGIFADPEPNPTHTIIGGENLVAVDWVGASKMGIEPKISRYMELAVKAFGKPEIQLIGDPNPYRPWLNVPVALSLFAHYGLDANDYFGNLLYMSGAYMDEDQFPHKSESEFIKAARKAIKPLQEAIFLQAGGERTFANKLVSKFFTYLGR
jgi:cholesterol oxidase